MAMTVNSITEEHALVWTPLPVRCRPSSCRDTCEDAENRVWEAATGKCAGLSTHLHTPIRFYSDLRRSSRTHSRPNRNNAMTAFCCPTMKRECPKIFGRPPKESIVATKGYPTLTKSQWRNRAKKERRATRKAGSRAIMLYHALFLIQIHS